LAFATGRKFAVGGKRNNIFLIPQIYTFSTETFFIAEICSKNSKGAFLAEIIIFQHGLRYYRIACARRCSHEFSRRSVRASM
jgi:hypothetical protein